MPEDVAGLGVGAIELFLVAIQDVEVIFVDERDADVAGEFLASPGDVRGRADWGRETLVARIMCGRRSRAATLRRMLPFRWG